MKKFATRFFLLAIIGVFYIVGLASASADQFTIRVSAPHPPVVPYLRVAQKGFFPAIEKRVKAETGHDIKFIKAWAGTAVPAFEQSTGLSKGVVDMAHIVVIFEQARLPLYAHGFSVPFTTPDPLVATRVAQRMFREVPELQQSVDKMGITILAPAVTEDYGIGTKFPFRKLEDLKGKTISGGGANASWLKPLGAALVTGPIQRAYQQIQTGVSDGLLVFISPMVIFKFNQITKYFTKAHFGSVMNIVVGVNNKSFAKLPAKVRKIIRQEADRWAVAAGKDSAMGEKRMEAVLAKTPGYQISELAAGERVRWAGLLANIPNQAAQRSNKQGLAGTKVWRTYLRMLAEEGYKPPVTYKID